MTADYNLTAVEIQLHSTGKGKGVDMNQGECVRHYVNALIGWVELRVSNRAVRSVRFIEEPEFPQLASTSAVMEQLVLELDSYFMGNLKVFSIQLEEQPGTPFQRRVWEKLQEIPYGETRSYSAVAQTAGNPNAARAVGLANGSNIIPIIIPCHRVIKSDGSLGGYGPGPHIKKKLLELEGIELVTRRAGKTVQQSPSSVSGSGFAV